MSTGKKASAVAVKAASKLTGQELGKSTHWSQVFDIFMDGFNYAVYKKCQPDVTLIYLFRDPGEKSDLVQKFSLPNSEVWSDNEGDWDWNLIWKTLTEWLIQNRKKVLKPVRKKQARKAK